MIQFTETKPEPRRAVMLSVQPVWCEKILSLLKSREIRKTFPRIEGPFKCYIYQTKSLKSQHILEYGGKYDAETAAGCGKVIAEFTCPEIDPVRFYYHEGLVDVVDCNTSCLSPRDILKYAGGQRPLYGWVIKDLKKYSKPKELSEFKKYGLPGNLTRPPQSWCYVEEMQNE